MMAEDVCSNNDRFSSEERRDESLNYLQAGEDNSQTIPISDTLMEASDQINIEIRNDNNRTSSSLSTDTGSRNTDTTTRDIPSNIGLNHNSGQEYSRTQNAVDIHQVKGVPVRDAQLEKHRFYMMFWALFQMYLALTNACIDAALGNRFESMFFALGGFSMMVCSYSAVTRRQKDYRQILACFQTTTIVFLVMHLVRALSVGWHLSGVSPLEPNPRVEYNIYVGQKSIDDNLTKNNYQKVEYKHFLEILQLIISMCLCAVYLGSLLISIKVVKIMRRVTMYGPILPLANLPIVTGVSVASSTAAVSSSYPFP